MLPCLDGRRSGEDGTARMPALFGEVLFDPELLVFTPDVECCGTYVMISAAW